MIYVSPPPPPPKEEERDEIPLQLKVSRSSRKYLAALYVSCLG